MPHHKREMASIGKSSPESRSVCSICYTEENKTTRRMFVCPNSKCEEIFCFTCLRYSIGDMKNLDCSICKHPLSFEWCHEIVSRNFASSVFKPTNDNYLLEQQKKLIPETMPIIERIAEMRKASEIIRNFDRTKLFKSDEAYREYNRCRLLLEEWHTFQTTGIIREKKKKTEETKYVKCQKDNCSSFVDLLKNIDGVCECSVCETRICSECMEKVGEENHVCDKNTLKSVKYMIDNSKPCPNKACGVRTSKKDGCNHMWCVYCNTGWQWDTGKILENKKNTNPYFYAYMRKVKSGEIKDDAFLESLSGGNSGNSEGMGGMGGGCRPTLEQLYSRWMGPDRSVFDLPKVHMILSHIQSIEIPRLTNTCDYFKRYRISHLLGHITEERWKEHISNEDRRLTRNKSIRDAMTLFSELCDERLRNFVNDETVEISVLAVELNNIRKYYNELVYKISKLYNIKVGVILYSWEFENLKAGKKTESFFKA